jgi:putative endonuclease
MENTFTVYVLYSIQFDKIYVGYTSDLIRRFYSHNVLGTKDWTRNHRPWFVVHTEIYTSKSESVKREKELKSYQGRRFIRNECVKKYFP